MVKNLKILIQIVPDVSIYPYSCTPQSCMVAAIGLLIEERLCNIKLFYQKPKILDEEMESKLDKYSKGNQGSINSKQVK